MEDTPSGNKNKTIILSYDPSSDFATFQILFCAPALLGWFCPQRAKNGLYIPKRARGGGGDGEGRSWLWV